MKLFSSAFQVAERGYMLGRIADQKLGRRRRRGSMGNPQRAVLVGKGCKTSETENVAPLDSVPEDDYKPVIEKAPIVVIESEPEEGEEKPVVPCKIRTPEKREVKLEADEEEAADAKPKPPAAMPKTQAPTTKKAPVTPAQPKRRRRKPKTPKTPPVQSHKITEYFPVRRSERKTGKQIERESQDCLRKAIHTGSNELLLDVYTCEVKGRGVRASVPFRRNDFVVEYKGDMIPHAEAKIREARYALDPSIGSYMYFFKHKGRNWCVDATEESPYKGRLVNHSLLKPNLKTKVVEFGSKHYLVLIALRDIEVGEELLYDYGDRDPHNIAQNPWLVTS